ncbi:MAG: hypothetical protein HS111_16520 [Kofleriaceae bacterium]|nr:hypothetical protein [Kofleriaceae bacterium]
MLAVAGAGGALYCRRHWPRSTAAASARRPAARAGLVTADGAAIASGVRGGRRRGRRVRRGSPRPLPPELVEALPPSRARDPPGEPGAGAAATPGGASRGVRRQVLAPPRQPALRAAQLAVVLDGVDATRTASGCAC